MKTFYRGLYTLLCGRTDKKEKKIVKNFAYFFFLVPFVAEPQIYIKRMILKYLQRIIMDGNENEIIMGRLNGIERLTHIFKCEKIQNQL